MKLFTFLLLCTCVTAYHLPIHEGKVFLRYERIDEQWNETFEPNSRMMSNVFRRFLPQILSFDDEAYKYDYTCTVSKNCTLGLHNKSIICLPNLEHYPENFLNTSYENLTTLWCEKITTDNTIALSSKINKNDLILKDSCFLVVKTFQYDFDLDSDNNLSRGIVIFGLIICFIIMFIMNYGILP